VRAEAQGLVLSVTPGSEVDAAQDDAIQVVVTGEQEEGYVVDNATTATRTNTPIRDVPQSITVIPQQVIGDQQVTQISDALRNVSGVSSRFSSSGLMVMRLLFAALRALATFLQTVFAILVAGALFSRNSPMLSGSKSSEVRHRCYMDKGNRAD
jgi:outer membrane receptor protein involved in Fe transport